MAGEVTFYKSIFGLTVQSAKYNKSVDIPMNALHKLIRYMMYKERNADTFQALCAHTKILANDDKEIKDLGQ